MNNNNKNKKQKQTHRYRKQTDSCQTGGFWEADEKDEMDQAKKKKEILPFATAWMDLESIVPSEISQSEKDKYHIISLICGI